MDYQIEIEEGIEQRYVGFALTCDPEEFPVRTEQILTEVWSLLDTAEVPPVGPPFCLVPQIKSVDDPLPPETPWQLICGFPVEDQVVAEDPVKVGILPGGRILTTVHRGRLDTLSTAYLALQVHMMKEGLEPNGSPWEIYLTDPVWEPDESQWRTVVRWPIR